MKLKCRILISNLITAKNLNLNLICIFRLIKLFLIKKVFFGFVLYFKILILIKN